MRRQSMAGGTTWRVLLLVGFIISACGGRSGPPTRQDVGAVEAGKQTGLLVGVKCSNDAECASGVCWDYAHYDPLCGGAICSGSCSTDAQCRTLARQAQAQRPDAASCGSDGRCDLVSTVLGSFYCQ